MYYFLWFYRGKKSNKLVKLLDWLTELNLLI